MWVLFSLSIFTDILVSITHPEHVAMFKGAFTSPSNAVDLYHSFSDKYIAHAHVKGVWRDSQNRTRIPVIV